jgi:general secretion pathway protein D
MVTEIFPIENTNVDYASSKIRHLISKSAKLVTDKESNSIVITDFPQNIATIKKVISIISKNSKKYIKIVKLKNIKAANVLGDLKNVAKTIYNEKIIKEKVGILLNKDTNSIMFVGKKKNVDYLVKYLQNIDKDGSMIAKTVNVIYLKNAESKNVIKMLQGIISNKKYKDPNKKPYVSSDEESNSIILMGQKDELDYFKELISKLDVDRQQVYVKARIIEISEKRTRDVGIKYGLTGSIANSNGLTSISAALSENYSLPSIPLVSSAGSVINKDVLAMGVGINLLNQNGAADIVSEPSLLCINNKKSSIYVGQTVSIKTATNTSTGGVTNDSFKREDVGLTLAVKPRISNGGKVLLEISTKVEDVSKSDGANGQPDTSKKELSTSAIVNNGESVILGGYIKETKSNTEDKVPFFGDIPILGALFRNNREVKDKINLVIIITPYIVPKSKDLTYIRNQLAQLKILEDKYTKDTILRLKQAKLKSKQDDIIRDEEVKQIDKTQKALSSKRKGNNSKKNEKSQREQLDQEVKQMFGI